MRLIVGLMFACHGGQKMLGFPGVYANNAENIKKFSDGRRFVTDPVSIADMS